MSSALVVADESSSTLGTKDPLASLSISSRLPVAAPTPFNAVVPAEADAARVASTLEPQNVATNLNLAQLEAGPDFTAIWEYLRGLDLPKSVQPRSSVVCCDNASSIPFSRSCGLRNHGTLFVFLAMHFLNRAGIHQTQQAPIISPWAWGIIARKETLACSSQSLGNP